MTYKHLESFAQQARTELNAQVAAKLRHVLTADTPDLRGRAASVKGLQEAIRCSSEEQVIERVAYTWFNRFCALRFMDANDFNTVRVVSPAEGYSQPELLQEARKGLVEDDLPVERDAVTALLQGQTPSPDPQQEAYRILLVGACNRLHEVMSFLFESIADYTELLLPDDLLSDQSILSRVREALTDEACQDVEVLGWLYQYYISEKKDDVFAALKKNKKIAAEDIPAATQLFTPHWIVKYLVENSLGRLWLLNRPQSRLAEKMEFYIKPEQEETDFLKVDSPEDLTVCDPAVGSGHMLTYAFDLLYAIYEEEGYNPSDIPQLILEKNLYGIEIDERAGTLAALALCMKARAKDRRFFKRNVRPHICVLQPTTLTDAELHDLPWFKNLDSLEQVALTVDLKTFSAPHTLHAARIKNIGSLYSPRLTVEQIESIRSKVQDGSDLFASGQSIAARSVLDQLSFLSRKYHVVVANPPYMGSKGMNADLKAYAKKEHKDAKSDLFAMFMERILRMLMKGGETGMVTPFTWMFLSSYEKLRTHILNASTLSSLVRPEYHAFFESAYVPLCAFTISEAAKPEYKGAYIDLQKFYGADLQPIKALEAISNPECGWFYRASASDFLKIPGAPIAYWVSEQVLNVFQSSKPLSDFGKACQGLATADNDRFVRTWSEVSFLSIGLGLSSRDHAASTSYRWFPYNKGGDFKKWYGNQSFIVNWENNGQELHDFKPRSVIRNPDTYFRSSLSWSKISSSKLSMRWFPKGFIYDVAGCSIFFEDQILAKLFLGVANSKVMEVTVAALSPTLNFEVGQLSTFPVVPYLLENGKKQTKFIEHLIETVKADWNESEVSWGFGDSPLIKSTSVSLRNAWKTLKEKWSERIEENRRLEEENNNFFIKAYDLQDELTPEVPLNEITLNCNPHYRYGPGKTEEEYKALQKADTMREFISYAVGCIFGRYSLDKPGLILANQGETVEDYIETLRTPDFGPRTLRFAPDEDNVIPVLADTWFEDDIVERFNRFLKVTFGEAHFEENVAFIEEALGRDVRNYFVREFYTHHVKMYKKRPIYWLFSSPKGSFNALIYMHRYRPDTVSVILNDYLRAFMDKLEARKRHLEQVSVSGSASSKEKTAALKEIDKLAKTLVELTEYDKEILYPLALQQIEIDLDDGVKANYPKFGKALKKVAGLS